jgi:hypothetical protein
MATHTINQRGAEFGFTTETFNLIVDRLPALTHDKPGCPCGCGIAGICMDLVRALPTEPLRRAAVTGRINTTTRAAIAAAGAELKKARGTAPLVLHDENWDPYTTAPHAEPEPKAEADDDFYARTQRAERLARDPATWARLDNALTFCLLLDEQGRKRQHRAHEFMLMHVNADGTQAFKHSGSRNYIFLLPSGSLYVPVTQEAFMRGTF